MKENEEKFKTKYLIVKPKDDNFGIYYIVVSYIDKHQNIKTLYKMKNGSSFRCDPTTVPDHETWLKYINNPTGFTKEIEESEAVLMPEFNFAFGL